MNVTKSLDVGVAMQFVDGVRSLGVWASAARPVLHIDDSLKVQRRVGFSGIVKLCPIDSVWSWVDVERKEDEAIIDHACSACDRGTELGF